MNDPLDEIFVEKHKPIIDKLKEKLYGWETSLALRKSAYSQSKKDLIEAERIFKIKKKTKAWAYRQLKEAEKEVIKAKSKVSSYPRNNRYYAKKHMDKVFNLMEKNSQ